MKAFLDTPTKIWLQITNSCNLGTCRCCYGNCSRESSSKELTLDEWYHLIDEIIDQGVMHFYFEGGEPLNRPEFMQVLQYCKGKVLVWFRTNGTLITSDLAHQLKDLKVGTVVVDLLGARRETHDYLTGVPGSYNLTLEGIRNLVKADIPTLTSCIINRKNMAEMQDYLELVHAMGVKRAGILRLYPIGRAKTNWDELSPSLEETMATLRALRPPEGLHLMQSWHPKDGNCCWENAGINAYGDSIGCPYLREFVNYGNIKRISFLETWNDPLYKQLRSGDVVDPCPDCEANEGTHGGCRASAYAFTGHWDAPDPFCVRSNKGVDLRVLPEWLLQKETESTNTAH
jgi:radical SAM protein with 4Fe4S-binding SPASM domain